MSILVVTGTGTEVGKTVVCAAVVALALDRGRRVAVFKPVQSGVGIGEPGDLAEITRLAGKITSCELRRYSEPLAPETAARRAGQPSVGLSEIVAAAITLDAEHHLVVIEGTGGLLVRFDAQGSTLADVACSLEAPVLVVAQAGLGTLNMAALTAEALAWRGVECTGVVIGRWPSEPDLAARCNLVDLPSVAGAPLLGALPDGMAALSSSEFLAVARRSLAPKLGGNFDSRD